MIEIAADEVAKITISKEPVTGWIGWYKTVSYPHWTFISNFHPNANIVTCPYPLFETKELITESLKKYNANTDEVTIKALKVTL